MSPSRSRLVLQALDDRIVPDGTPFASLTDPSPPPAETSLPTNPPPAGPTFVAETNLAGPEAADGGGVKEARIKEIDARIKEIKGLVANLDKTIAVLDKNTQPLQDALDKAEAKLYQRTKDLEAAVAAKKSPATIKALQGLQDAAYEERNLADAALKKNRDDLKKAEADKDALEKERRGLDAERLNLVLDIDESKTNPKAPPKDGGTQRLAPTEGNSDA